MSLRKKFCTNCGNQLNNTAQGFCNQCGHKIAQSRALPGSSDSTINSSNALSDPVSFQGDVTPWKGDASFGDHIHRLELSFHEAAQKLERDDLSWRLIDRHLVAAEINNVVQGMHQSLRNKWADTYVQLQSQRADSMIEWQKRVHEREITEKIALDRLNSKIDRFADALDHLEKRFFNEGRLSQLPEEMRVSLMSEMVEKLKAEVFGTSVDQLLDTLMKE